MTAVQLNAAKYAVQKYRRLKDARELTERLHVTQSEIETSKRAARHAETMFNCAMEELCAEFPENADGPDPAKPPADDVP